jgi:hypothetical protein
MKKNSRPLFCFIIIATVLSVLYTSYLTLIKKNFVIVEIEEESLNEEGEIVNFDNSDEVNVDIKNELEVQNVI